MDILPGTNFVDVMNFVTHYNQTRTSRDLSLGDLYHVTYTVCSELLKVSSKSLPDMKEVLLQCRDYLCMYFEGDQNSARPKVILAPYLHYTKELEILDDMKSQTRKASSPNCYIPMPIKLLYAKCSSDTKTPTETDLLLMAFLNASQSKCAYCELRDKSKLKRCSACKSVFYCGQACQGKDRPVHKPFCTSKKI